MYCTNCGKENPDTNRFCLQCGQPLGAGSAPASSPTTQAQSRGSSRRLLLVLGGVVALIAIVAAAYFLLPGLTGGGARGGREMLLAAPNRQGEVDLMVLRLGDDPEAAVTIAENVGQAVNDDGDPGVYLGALADTGDVGSSYGGSYGSFLPGTDRLVAFYADDGETRLTEYRLGADAPTEILGVDDGLFFGLLVPDSNDLFIMDYSGLPDMRCFLAAPGAKADRIARADNCYPTVDGRLLTEDRNSDNELTLTVADLDGTGEVMLLEDVDATFARVSSDASHVVFLSRTDDGEMVTLQDAAGQELYQSEEFEDISDLGFVGETDLAYFVALNDDGERELHTSAGGRRALIEAPSISALSAPGRRTLAVLTADEDGASELHILDAQSGTLTEALSGDNMTLAGITDPPRLLVRHGDDDELTLVAVEPTGASPVTLFDDNDYTLRDAKHRTGHNRIFLELGSEDGRSLYVAHLDGTAGYFVLEEWSDFRIINATEEYLLLSGREDARDDPILYALNLRPGAQLIELDDTADAYGFGVIAPDGRTALYNATVGSRVDDVVVRQVRLDGEEAPQDLYDEMLLMTARWAEINPFSPLNALTWHSP